MSVQVKELTKIYGTQKALDAVSFSAPEGSITCFLGPNGAGKSTTMKIAVGFLNPTAGEVLVHNTNVQADPIAVKKMIGYLPEHNPLYLELYIREFLRFVAGAYGLSTRSAKQRIEEIIMLCGLDREKHKKIGQLSKGYRQRVGLAKALLPDPKVLILDEPTTGLDPNQIVEMRQLIRKVSRDKTVILSTHIMQEVEALAEKVVIINQGRLVADDTLENLKRKQNQASLLEVVFDAPLDIQLLSSLSDNFEVKGISQGIFHISGDEQQVRREIMKLAGEKDLPLASVKPIGQSLEDIFHLLTRENPSKT